MMRPFSQILSYVRRWPSSQSRCREAALRVGGLVAFTPVFLGGAVLCEAKEQVSKEGKQLEGLDCHDIDAEDDDFEFNPAMPPVVPADFDVQQSVSVTGGLLSGSWPVAE